MFRVTTFLAFALLLLTAGWLRAAECTATVAEGLPEGVDPSIADKLEPKHIKLTLADDQELCQIWTTKTWMPITAEAEKKLAEPPPKEEEDAAAKAAPVTYKIQPGSLVGVIQIATTALDLRQQEIPAGTYTLRYAVQPTFEAHRDTHDTRDFLLLISPEKDASAEVRTDADELIGWSADSVGAPHPAFLPLVTPAEGTPTSPLRPDERDPEGWVLRLEGKTADGKPVPMELIVLSAADSL
jgi:hypothetical protein